MSSPDRDQLQYDYSRCEGADPHSVPPYVYPVANQNFQQQQEQHHYPQDGTHANHEPPTAAFQAHDHGGGADDQRDYSREELFAIIRAHEEREKAAGCGAGSAGTDGDAAPTITSFEAPSAALAGLGVSGEPATNEPMKLPVWDTDPTVVKMPLVYTARGGGPAAVSQGAPPPVLGYIVALPFAIPPKQDPSDQHNPITMAAVVGIPAVTCSFCQSNCYTGRNVDSSRLSIVAPTASMSGQDGLNGPAHGIDGELFRPCLCDKYYHRGCFREMRGGMSYFRHSSYYECPDCMFTYKMERVMGGMKRRQRMDAQLNGGMMAGPAQPNPMGGGGNGASGGFETVNTDELSESAIKWEFRRRVAFMWITALIVYVAGSAAVGAIAYGGDGDNKDIPVFIKMLLTSVSFEYPSDESLEAWRAEFRRPDVPVWHYYGAFGVFSLCLFIILCAMLYYCCCASNMNGGDIRPPLRSFFCCDGDLDEALIERRAHQQRQVNLSGLNPNMAEAVQYSSQKREDELKQYYEEQSKWYHFFSCGRPTSFQYHDHRMDEQTPQQQPSAYGGNAAMAHNGGMAPAGGAQNTYPSQEVMVQLHNGQNAQQQQQQNEQKVEPASTGATTTNYYYNGNTQYYGNTYYYYNYSDPCCIQVCCCPSGHRHPKASTCGSCGSCGDTSCGSCDCGDCDCKGSDCNCNGGCGGGGGEAVLAVGLFILLIVVIIVIVSAILGSLVFLISRTFRLSSEASQMVYIQALEKEDHVFVLGINETWRPTTQRGKKLHRLHP